ncbi:MAG: flagellar hook-length control protein FliK, partial [Wujia sp.]
KIIETLTGYIMDSLGIDEEKLSSILQDMDIQAVDLLDSDKLKAFVLYASDSKEVDMLINEDLSQLVNETMEALQNIIDEFDMESDFPKLIEEFKAVIQDKEINLSETAKMQNPDREKVMQNEPNADKIVDNEVGYTQTDTAEEASNKNFKENGHEDSKENRLSDNLNHAIDIAFGSADGIEEASFVNEINEADIVKQIIDDIKANVTRDTRSLEIKLNPENLGKISITVTEKEGVMQARIIADNEAARNAIETSLSLLKEAFDNQELKVDAVEVMIADYESFNQEQTEGENQDSEGQMKGQASGINLDDLDEEDSISEEQRLEVEIMRANGNRLSYSI